MPTIPDGILQCRIFISTPRGQWSSLLYWEPASAFTDATNMTDVADGFFTYFETEIPAAIGEDANFDGVYVRYKSATLDLEGYSTAETIGGAYEGLVLPDQDCVEIRRLTGKPGRNKRGRIFISGISQIAQHDGVIADGLITPLMNIAGKISADAHITPHTFHARHWDRKNNVMEPLSGCKVLKRLVSRRDRAKRIPYQAI